MNSRKKTDYSEMYEALDKLIAKQHPQMELYCEIGKTVCRRAEKGAAVIASEYLNQKYPDVKGFSPRNLRRMRDFYRTYESHPALLRHAMQLGWTQNVVIMEAELTMEMREWYMKAALLFSWSKAELFDNISEKAHETVILNVDKTAKCDENVVADMRIKNMMIAILIHGFKQLLLQYRNLILKDYRRRCYLVR